jgi:hypothetical protein
MFKHLKRTKCMFFLKHNFFSCLPGSGIHIGKNNESHTLKNCRFKILVLESESEPSQKKNSGFESEKKNVSDPHYCCTVLCTIWYK